MPRLRIDHREIAVPAGSTILDAARGLGLDIPTLCFADGYTPTTSCMLCLVKVKRQSGLVPACATLVEEGMEIESETDEVRLIRRTGLELLLSDHVGDCTAPCQSTCPTHMDIPLMLRQVAGGRWTEAIATVKKDIALPAVLGRVCPELCERTCRRRDVDSPASICLVKRAVADVDLASKAPHLPPCRLSTGRSVAIVGAGPAGLSAAYHLLQAGHAATLFDDHAEPGGRLRYEADESQLPRKVLDAEIAIIEKLGARFQLETKIGKRPSLAALGEEFDAVLIAVGPLGAADTKCLGLAVTRGRLQVNPQTHATSAGGVFAAGDVVQPGELIVRSVADGKAGALCIDQYLSGAEVTGAPRAFQFRSGRPGGEELVQLTVGAGDADRVTPSRGPASGLTEEEARAEALRCLHCDCGKAHQCKLRHYAQVYGAKANRYRGERRTFERHLQHGDVVYEPGKCILCGLCVQIATEAGEPLGLSLIGRGFDVRVGVPFNGSIADGLTHAGRRCAQACPTGALALRNEGGDNGPSTAGDCSRAGSFPQSSHDEG